MGQKVHPYGFRVGTLYGWQSNWYADKKYSQQLHEDIKVRAFIKKKLFHAGISKVVIERTGDKIVINIHTARPGILIGKRGAEVETLRKELKASFAERGIKLTYLAFVLKAVAAALCDVPLVNASLDDDVPSLEGELYNSVPSNDTLGIMPRSATRKGSLDIVIVERSRATACIFG